MILGESDTYREGLIKQTATYSLLEPALDIDSITDSVSGFLKMEGIGGIFYDAVNGIYDMLFPLGIAIIGTYFLMHFITTSSKESVTVESFIKSLISLVAVMAILNNMKVLINKTLSLGDTFITNVNGVLSSSVAYDSSSVAVAMCNKCFGPFISNKVFSLITSNHGFSFFLFALVMWLLHWVVLIGAYIAAASRLLDIGWRMAAMPIGIADVFEGGMHSNGIRYFKSFVASVLAGGLMIMIISIGTATAESIILSSLYSESSGTAWSDDSGWSVFTNNVSYTINVMSGEAKTADDFSEKFSSSASESGDITLSSEDEDSMDFGFRVMAVAAAVQIATIGAAIGAPAKAKELMS